MNIFIIKKSSEGISRSMLKKMMKLIKKTILVSKNKGNELSEQYYILRVLKGVIRRIKDDNVSELSAQITYYLLLALFPFLIFVLNLLMYFDVNQTTLMNGIRKIIPVESSDLVFSIVDKVISSSGVTFLSIGMIMTLWSATKGANAMIKGLNKAYDVKEERSFFVVKGVGIIVALGIPLMMIASFIFLVLGEQIGQFVSDKLGLVDYLGLWELLRVLIPLSGMSLYFTLLYKLTPNRHIKFKHAAVGGIFSTIGWVGISMLFSFYVSHFGNYSNIYGGLGSIIILLLWLKISSTILIIGGEINAEIANPFNKRGMIEHRRN